MTKKLPTYNDDEVKIFHPLFEYSFKPIILNNKKYFLEYELKHHRKLKNGLIPDYVFQNKKSKQSVLICELKRTKSSVFNFNFNEQVKGYAETLSEEMEKPFYLLTNLEVINLFKYSTNQTTTFVIPQTSFVPRIEFPFDESNVEGKKAHSKQPLPLY